MTNSELLKKVDKINHDAKVRRISEQIEAKEQEIEKIKIEITDLNIKKINLLQDSLKTQPFSLINDIMKNNFKL